MMASKEKIKDYCSFDLDYFKRLSDPYDYLINTYIPNQGERDMAAFLEMGMNPFAYLLWKFVNADALSTEFSGAIKERIIDVFGKFPQEVPG